MPNFSLQIPGEPEPRGFQYDIDEQALYTDMDFDSMLTESTQKRLKITESTAQNDPQTLLYWQETAVYRNTYHLCEDEGISFEEAFDKATLAAEANGQPHVPPKSDPMQADPGPDLSGFDDEDAARTSPMAGIVITNQQLILGALMILVEHPEDSKAKLIEYFKTKLEEIDGYEIVI